MGLPEKVPTIRQLLLLRHAKASKCESSQPDQERPLRHRGRMTAAMMRRMMKSEELVPDLVLVSPARRAMETLEALRPWSHPPSVEVTEALYLADAPRLLEILRETGEQARSILVIGHNPGLHDLAQFLVGPHGAEATGKSTQRLFKSFPTCALAELTFDCPWSMIDEGTAQLIRFVTPREFRDV